MTPASLLAGMARLRNALARTNQPRTIQFTVDGGGAAIAAGKQAFGVSHLTGRIEGWCLMADRVGSIVIDIWKVPFSDAPPDAGDSICGGYKPQLASQEKAECYGTLPGWDVDVEAGDVVFFNVDSAATVQQVILTLRVQLA